MKQNKHQLIFDYYKEVSLGSLFSSVQYMTSRGVLFAVEPWPDNKWRIYVKKDARHTFDEMEEHLKL